MKTFHAHLFKDIVLAQQLSLLQLAILGPEGGAKIFRRAMAEELHIQLRSVVLGVEVYSN